MVIRTMDGPRQRWFWCLKYKEIIVEISLTHSLGRSIFFILQEAIKMHHKNGVLVVTAYMVVVVSLCW